MQWRELYLLRFGPKPEGLVGLQKLLILLNFTCIKADLCIHLKKKCLLQMPISAMHDQMNEWCLKMLKNLEFSFFLSLITLYTDHRKNGKQKEPLLTRPKTFFKFSWFSCDRESSDYRHLFAFLYCYKRHRSDQSILFIKEQMQNW